VPAECTEVALFEFTCLIRYDSNSKGKKVSLEEISTSCEATDKYMGTHSSSVKQFGL
jgi:hypothetical protein